MTEPSAAVRKYKMPRVYAYIRQVEVAYGISIKSWVDFRPAGGADPDLCVFSWGSGDAFDLIPEGVQPRAFVIYTEESDGLGEALYYSVRYIQTLIEAIREPLGPPPAL